MLEELAKEDKRWRQIAFVICGDKDLANDLTNDMYLKFYDRNITDISVNLVFTVIKNLFIDHLRQQSKTQKLYINTINNELTVFECREVVEKRIMINNALNELSFHDREILLHTHERSLRKNEEELNIGRGTLERAKKIALERIKETETIKNSNENRNV